MVCRDRFILFILWGGCLVNTNIVYTSLILLSRSRERSKEGQRGCQTSAWGLPFNVYLPLSPKAKSPLGTRATQTPSGLPPSPQCSLCPKSSFPHGPRGGVPQPYASFVYRCAAPLYGLAALPGLHTPLQLVVIAATERNSPIKALFTQRGRLHPSVLTSPHRSVISSSSVFGWPRAHMSLVTAASVVMSMPEMTSVFSSWLPTS